MSTSTPTPPLHNVADTVPSLRARTVSASRFALPALLVVLVSVFSTLAPTTFATVDNFRTILATQAVLALVALAALLTLVVGEFDLSLGAQMGLAALLVPGLCANGVLSIPVAIVLSIAVTTGVGFLNGLLVAKAQVNSFIVTIGTAALINALVLAYSGGTVIFDGVPQELIAISATRVFGVPLPVVYVAVAATIVWILLKRTPFGRYIAAVGGSKDAARLSGINTSMVTISTLTIAGTLCGIAGVVQAGQLGSGNPAVGPAFLLPAFAAVFLGATAYHVGQFNVWGTVTAVVTLGAGVAGLNLLGLPSWVEPAFNGTALLVAVIATRYLRGAPL